MESCVSGGLLFPLQLVITKKPPKEEYTWRSRLHKDLDIKSNIKPLAIAYKDNMWDPRYQAVMDLIIRANQEQYEEGMKMCEALRELFADELKEREEVGLERGALLKLFSLTRKKIQKGLLVKEIAEILEEPEQLIRAIVQVMNKYPDGTDEDICGYLITEGADTSVYGSSGK